MHKISTVFEIHVEQVSSISNRYGANDFMIYPSAIKGIIEVKQNQYILVL